MGVAVRMACLDALTAQPDAREPMSPQQLPTRTPPQQQPRPLAYVNARIIDPASAIATRPGGVLIEDGMIADLGPHVARGGAPEDAEIVDCGGHVPRARPVDMRVQLREPGEEHKETLADRQPRRRGRRRHHDGGAAQHRSGDRRRRRRRVRRPPRPRERGAARSTATAR